MAADVTLKAGHAVMTPSPDPGDQRGNPGYGTAQQVPGPPAVTTPAPATTTPAPTGTVRAITTAPATTPTTAATGPTRGRPGYSQGISASPVQSPSLPTGTAQGTPGTGVNSAGATPTPKTSADSHGLSAGTRLAVTGAPLGGTLALGGLMLAGGATAVWYTRRRRSA